MALLLTACTTGGEAGTTDDDAATGAAEEAAGEPVDADDEDGDVEPSGRLLLSGFRDDHPGGASVELTFVEVDEAGHILLGFEAVHAAAGSGGLDVGQFTSFIVDDRGGVYLLDRPADNRWLSVPKDHRMSGVLAFPGPIDADARRITFALNQRDEDGRVGAADDGRISRTPRFVVADVPLPGVGLEDEATDPDALGVLDSQTVDVGLTEESEDNPEVEVTVVSYETDGRTTLVTIAAVNRSSEPVAILNDRPSLTDDLGRRLGYLRVQSEDGAERQLLLQPGDEGEATLAFRGAPVPSSSELRLALNTVSGGEGRPRTPTFRFAVPVPDDE